MAMHVVQNMKLPVIRCHREHGGKRNLARPEGFERALPNFVIEGVEGLVDALQVAQALDGGDIG